MAEVWARWGGVLVATAAAVPLCLLMVVGLAAYRRRRGWPRGPALRFSAAEVVGIAGTLRWLWMLLTPGTAARSVNLVPLRDLAVQVAGDPTELVIQIVGNLLVFAALGTCLPLRYRVGLPAVAAVAAAGSVLVETLQYVLDLGRVSSVDDVLVNTLGAVLAALCSRPWWLRSVSRTALR